MSDAVRGRAPGITVARACRGIGRRPFLAEPYLPAPPELPPEDAIKASLHRAALGLRVPRELFAQNPGGHAQERRGFLNRPPPCLLGGRVRGGAAPRGRRLLCLCAPLRDLSPSTSGFSPSGFARFALLAVYPSCASSAAIEAIGLAVVLVAAPVTLSTKSAIVAIGALSFFAGNLGDVRAGEAAGFLPLGLRSVRGFGGALSCVARDGAGGFCSACGLGFATGFGPLSCGREGLRSSPGACAGVGGLSLTGIALRAAAISSRRAARGSHTGSRSRG